MLHRLLAPVILLVIACGAGHAAATLEHLNAGSRAGGPALAAGDLAGRVVLFEYWGIHCGPCLASIPHLAELQEKFGRENFIVVANQCQDADDATAYSVWLSLQGGEHISVINHGELSGADVSSIPRCFLFDHEGKLIYDGHPAELGNRVEAAIKASPGALVVGHAYTKTAKYAQILGAQRSNFAASLKALRGLAAGRDAAAKDEAEFLLARVGAFATERLEAIGKARTCDPVGASEMLAHLLSILKGDELGRPAEAMLAELKSDKDFQNELLAATLLADIQARAIKIGLGGQGQPPKSAVTEIADAIKALNRRFPGTASAADARRLALLWRL